MTVIDISLSGGRGLPFCTGTLTRQSILYAFSTNVTGLTTEIGILPAGNYHRELSYYSVPHTLIIIIDILWPFANLALRTFRKSVHSKLVPKKVESSLRGSYVRKNFKVLMVSTEVGNLISKTSTKLLVVIMKIPETP